MRHFTLCAAGLAAMCHVSLAQAADSFCDGTLGKVKIADNVIVQSGEVCTLDETSVKGSVKVEPGGALKTLSARISGNIQADEAEWVEIGEGTSVDGNVQLVGTSGVPAVDIPNSVCGTYIKGDLQVKDSETPFALGCASGNQVDGNLQVQGSDVPAGFSGDALSITNNSVNADIQVDDNTSESGGIDISDNQTKQNLQCSGNSPAPAGSGNEVSARSYDQCADLAVEVGKKIKGDDLTCTGITGKEKYADVTVPAGEVCTLNGTKVKGNVMVESGGALKASSARIKGNVQAEEALWIEIDGKTRVNGNVQLKKTTGTPAPGMPNKVCGAKIKGNLEVTENTVPFHLGCTEGNKVKGNVQVLDNVIPAGFTGDVIAVTSSKIKGDLQFDDNTSAVGTFDISGNSVKENLQCSGNSPVPTGGGNDVRGDADGQCSGL